jgi:deoxyribonuclease V
VSEEQLSGKLSGIADLRHGWALSPAEARETQRRLAERVEREDCLGPVHTVAGVDVGFEAGGSITRAAVVVLDFPSLAPLEEVVARVPTTFPYVPGLLSFREGPAVLAAVAQLRQRPDLMLYDGQGIAHPRRLGIASHLGLLLDIPSIGVAKSRLIGRHEEPGDAKGAWAPLWDKEEMIGAVLRSRQGVAPLYVSIGHRVCLETALHWVLACTPRFRLPETTRRAHKLASG